MRRLGRVVALPLLAALLVLPLAGCEPTLHTETGWS